MFQKGFTEKKYPIQSDSQKSKFYAQSKIEQHDRHIVPGTESQLWGERVFLPILKEIHTKDPWHLAAHSIENKSTRSTFKMNV